MDISSFQFERVGEYIAAYGFKILTAIAIFFIGRYAIKMLTRLTRKAMQKARMDAILVDFLGNIIYGLSLAFVIIAALSQLGIQTTSLVAIIGAAGLAVGLALQSSLGNLASGVMMIVFRPFKKGDYVEVAGVAGSVEEIQIFTTTLQTPDNRTIIVPNGQITDGCITNYSARATRRLDLVMGIGYGDDIKKAKDVLTEVVMNCKYVLASPEPVIAVLSLGDSSVNLAVRPWVKTSDYWDAHFYLTEEIKLRFDKEGISIPFPQRDVYIYQETAKNTKAENAKKAATKPKAKASQKTTKTA